MTRTKSIIGALALCTLSICAFATASASAAGLTAVECTNVGAGHAYNTSACVTPATAGNFETVAIPLNSSTNVPTPTSTEIEPALRVTLGGLSFTVICEKGTPFSLSAKNVEPTAGQHKIVDLALRGIYEKCHGVLKANEAKYCAVEGITEPVGEGKITTTELEGETTGVEHLVKVKPVAAAGGVFAEFKILGKGGSKQVPPTENECFVPAGKPILVKVEGSVEGEVNTSNHAHLTFTEANNGANLKVGGNVAKYVDTIGGTTGTVVGAQTFT
jgi:hypothetical protein